MVFFFFSVSHSGVGFWKILALGLFFASHSAVGFWKVLAVEMNAQKQLKIDVLESSGCENQLTKKQLKRHMVFLFFDGSHSFGCDVFLL